MVAVDSHHILLTNVSETHEEDAKHRFLQVFEKKMLIVQGCKHRVKSGVSLRSKGCIYAVWTDKERK